MKALTAAAQKTQVGLIVENGVTGFSGEQVNFLLLVKRLKIFETLSKCYFQISVPFHITCLLSKAGKTNLLCNVQLKDIIS